MIVIGPEPGTKYLGQFDGNFKIVFDGGIGIGTCAQLLGQLFFKLGDRLFEFKTPSS